VEKDKGKQKENPQHEWVPSPPPPIAAGVTIRDDLAFRWRSIKEVEVDADTGYYSFLHRESSSFLSIKGVSSLWGTDFNPKAFIQAFMLSQLDRDMVREVGPHHQWIPLLVLLQGLGESLNSGMKSLRGRTLNLKRHRLIVPRLNRLWLKPPVLIRRY